MLRPQMKLCRRNASTGFTPGLPAQGWCRPKLAFRSANPEVGFINALLIAATLLLVTCPPSRAASDWPQWRGPRLDGTSTETNVPVRWSPTNGIAWKVPVPGLGHASPIVWQDRRTADVCARLRAAGHEDFVAAKTGLLLDPYFSATKLAWLLDNVDGARAAAKAGRLAFGTVDTFLLWRLTGGAVHATDATNAARTNLASIETATFDDQLAELFAIRHVAMPSVQNSATYFGNSLPELFGGAIAILGVAGDQQAATIGQGCFRPGMMKSTYGTGCFALLNIGDRPVRSKHKLLTTIAYRLNGQNTYALEGAIFIAGAAVQWLRDGLHLIAKSSDVEDVARKANPEHGVYMVPAFVGLGAPYWDAEARAAILGLTRDSGPAEIAAATLDSVCYQTRDLVEAMRADGAQIDELRVDGGMVVNDPLMQRLADTVGSPVERPKVTETTALGAAFLAGLQAGLWSSLDALSTTWALDRAFRPAEGAASRDRRYAGWQDAVRRVRSS